MDAEENQTQVSHGAHSPWKSLRDSHIPTAATRRGKVENEKHVSHFPACCFGVETEIRKETRRRIATLPPSGSSFDWNMLAMGANPDPSGTLTRPTRGGYRKQ
jgi:hypothetical protein